MNDSLLSKVKVLLRYITGAGARDQTKNTPLSAPPGSQNMDNLFPSIIRFRFSLELVEQIICCL